MQEAVYKIEVYEGVNQEWSWKKTHLPTESIAAASSQSFDSQIVARKDAEEKGVIAFTHEFAETIVRFDKGQELVVYTTC